MLFKTVLSLCDYSGQWARPWRAGGWQVILIDTEQDDQAEHGIDRVAADVRLVTLPELALPVDSVDVILAAPPCTVFTNSGAQYWSKRSPGEMLEALGVVDACLRLVHVYRPRVWAIENPIGRLEKWLGRHAGEFDPYEYAGYAADPPKDAYTKRTRLWGNFKLPEHKPLEPVRVCSQGSWIQKLGGKSKRTKRLRSTTPEGFAEAFYQANRS